MSTPSLRIVVPEVIVMETYFLIEVLARIYSDTSPPKKASFLPPLDVQFSKSVSKELVSFNQKTRPEVKQLKEKIFPLTGSPRRADGSG